MNFAFEELQIKNLTSTPSAEIKLLIGIAYRLQSQLF